MSFSYRFTLYHTALKNGKRAKKVGHSQPLLKNTEAGIRRRAERLLGDFASQSQHLLAHKDFVSYSPTVVGREAKNQGRPTSAFQRLIDFRSFRPLPRFVWHRLKLRPKTAEIDQSWPFPAQASRGRAPRLGAPSGWLRQGDTLRLSATVNKTHMVPESLASSETQRRAPVG